MPRTRRRPRTLNSSIMCQVSASTSPSRSCSRGRKSTTTRSRYIRSSRNRPSTTSLRRPALVADTMRTSTSCSTVPPTGVKRWSWSTRSSLAWMSRGSSATSSRNSVPRSDSVSRPWRSRTAPVKAPRTCPNSSLASMSDVKVAQFTAWNGRFARGLSWCRALATSSLPVPLSPRMSTVASLRAARRTSSKSFFISGATVTMPWKTTGSRSGCLTCAALMVRQVERS